MYLIRFKFIFLCKSQQVTYVCRVNGLISDRDKTQKADLQLQILVLSKIRAFTLLTGYWMPTYLPTNPFLDEFSISDPV